MVKSLTPINRPSDSRIPPHPRPPLNAFPLVLALQRVEAFQESLQISASIFSAIRRCPALARDRTILPAVLLGCCSENPVAARHAFAVLADQAAHSPDVVSQVRAGGGGGRAPSGTGGGLCC